MTDLDAAFVEFGRKYPTPHAHPSGGDLDWEGDCARFCYRFGAFTTPGWKVSPVANIGTAWDVAKTSGVLDTNPGTAGPGAQHFWKQKGVASGVPGHVATELAGHRLAMASAYCDEYLPGTVHLGYSTVASYNSRRGTVLQYMGHTTNYAGARIDATGTAGSGESPLLNSKEDDMTYALQYTVAGPELPATVALNSVFVGTGTEPLIWAGNWGPEQLNGVVPAPWNAQLIAQRISEVGIRGTGVNLNLVFASLADAMAAKNPVYTLGAVGSVVGLDAVVAKLTELESKLPTKGTLTLS